MRSGSIASAVLLLIDLQQAIDQPGWGERNNPNAEIQIERLLAHWRHMKWPVWHIRHSSTEPASHYRPGQPAHAFKPQAAPLENETVIDKQRNSAFIGTNLEALLKAAQHETLVVVGVKTNNSVEATVRMTGNLGFRTYLVEDACFTFNQTDWNGMPRSADEVHAMSLANLDDEYCSVIATAEILSER